MATKVFNIVGPTGPTGDTGVTGAQGPPGPSTISGNAGNTALLGSDSLIYVPTTPLANSTQNGLLTQLSGLTTDLVDGTNNIQNQTAAINPVIWSVRQRSFNALGNPNFEVNQRVTANALTNMPSGSFIADRWFAQKSMATGTFNWNCSGSQGYASGFSFLVSTRPMNFSVGTVQASLAAAEYFMIEEQVEGPALRELSGSHSISLLVSAYNTSQTPFHFSVGLRNPASTYSYTKLCTVPSNASQSLVQIPNIPAFPSAGSFSNTPGVAGYQLQINMGSGSTYTAPADGVWSAGNFIASPGTDNMAASSTQQFSVFYVQHEPGPECSPFMDIDFATNLLQCQRYWAKSNGYGTLNPTSNDWRLLGNVAAATAIRSYVRYPNTMAKVPTVTIYDNAGVANAIWMEAVGGSIAVSSTSGNADGIQAVNFASQSGAILGNNTIGQWRADTGW
jgi:hypothetical protein